jgi:hypothetical protein
MSPRHLGSIVDSQVQLWEMRQEHPGATAPEKVGKGGSVASAGAPAADGQKSMLRHPWLHYWGEAIVAELTRIGQPYEDGEAFLNDGMKENKPPGPAPASKPQSHH